MEMMRFLGACLLVFQAAVVLADDGDKQGAGLLDAGRLEKFVDELPDMPVLRGYGVGEGGVLVAGELTVGMYDTTWVMLLSRWCCCINFLGGFLVALLYTGAAVVILLTAAGRPPPRVLLLHHGYCCRLHRAPSSTAGHRGVPAVLVEDGTILAAASAGVLLLDHRCCIS